MADDEDKIFEWIAWLEIVPQKERDAAADLLMNHDLSSFEGNIAFGQAIMVAIVRGSISIAVGAELREWSKLTAGQIHAKNILDGTAKTSRVGRLREMSKTSRASNAPPPAALPDTDWDADEYAIDTIDAEEALPALVKFQK